MSTTIKLRRSSVPGNVPTTAQLEFGEIAINTADGKVYFRSGNSAVSEIQELSPHASDLLELIKTVDGASSGLDADLLDGQEGSYYLDFSNASNTATGVVAGTYGSSTEIPVLTIGADGRISVANTASVAGVDDFTWSTANSTLHLQTGDGTVYNVVIDTFDEITVNGNIIVTGTVDGRDVSNDGATLDALSASTTTVNLSGDVTGSATSNAGIIDITTDISNSGVAANTYGSSTEIPVIAIAADGRITSASTTSVAGVDDFTYTSANNTITLQTGDGSVFNIQTETEVTLTGDVTGTATATDGNISVTTDIANSGVVAGTYGSSSQIPLVTVGLDGRITAMSNAAVAGVDDVVWVTANSTLVIETGDGSVYNTVIDEFDEITVNGNIIVSGNVDGRDVSVDGAKLDLIEDNATADQTAAEILSALLTVDGAGTGLDADLLDGLHASDILAQAANTAAGAVGNGLITVTGNNGLIGTGNFNLNDFSNTSISIEHADTSSQASVDNADGNVIQDVTLDTYGHITGLVSVDLDTLYVPKTTQVIAGSGLTGGGLLSSSVTLSHDDTSSVTDVDNSNGNVIQDITFDTFGHVQTVASVDLDTRYLTQSDADVRYVNVTGDTMTGDLVVQANIDQDQSRFISGETTASSVFPFTGVQFSGITFGSAEITITAKDGANRHITKLLITHNNSTVIATEYGTVYTSSELANYDVNLTAGNVNVTFASVSGSTNFKIAGTLLKA